MTKLLVKPYDYQRTGIDLGVREKRVLLADEPGLGKTLQGIGIIAEAGLWPCVVVCPSALKVNWVREIKRFTGKDALLLTSCEQATWPYLLHSGMFQAVVVNYESLKKYFVWSTGDKKRGWRLQDVVWNPAITMFRSIIIDESHRVKDPAAQQTILCKGLATGKDGVVLLTGTPVVNRPEDLLAQLSILGRLGQFGGKSGFLNEYTVSTGRVVRGTEVREGRNLDQLGERLRSFMLRREKKDVLKELPEKTRTDVWVNISNAEEYEVAHRDLERYLVEYKQCTNAEVRRKLRMRSLVQMMTLRGLSAVGKVQPAIELIKLHLESDRSIIVFCALHDVVDAIVEAIPGALKVTGRETMAEKQHAVDSFQNGKCQVIVCSIKAAGVGLTLTASSTVLFVEFPWTWGDCVQCEDRAHRIGQKDNVTCYYLIGRGTIDKALYQIIYKKKGIASSIMGGEDTVPKDERYFAELAEEITNQNH